MIIKIQKSIYPPGRVLVYSKNKRICYLGKMPKAVKNFMNKKLKIYAYAHLENTQIVIDKIAPDQDW